MLKKIFEFLPFVFDYLLKKNNKKYIVIRINKRTVKYSVSRVFRAAFSKV